MRRIYESEALRRDDEDPNQPNERDRSDEARTINWSAASHALLPTVLRHRGIRVGVETNKSVYAREEPVSFRVSFRNMLPLPVVLRVPTQVRWEWAVDGYGEATLFDEPVPEEPSVFRFDRGTTKAFERTWHQRFREEEREWSSAAPGEHTLSAYVAVDEPEAKGLYAETTFSIE